MHGGNIANDHSPALAAAHRWSPQKWGMIGPMNGSSYGVYPYLYALSRRCRARLRESEPAVAEAVGFYPMAKFGHAIYTHPELEADPGCGRCHSA